MIDQWTRCVSFWILAALFAAGCTSTSTDTQPVDPLPPAETPQDRTPPPPDEPVETPAFDANGRPYYPGTTRLLPTTFYFAYDRAVLSPDDLSVLEMHATVLRNNRNKSVVVEGHADERGTREYNMALGERRAQAIANYMAVNGIARSRINTVSYGEERPLAMDSNDAAWAQNRRVELK